MTQLVQSFSVYQGQGAQYYPGILYRENVKMNPTSALENLINTQATKWMIAFNRSHTKNENGCWIWHARKNPKGYGLFRYNYHVNQAGSYVCSTSLAHRLAWVLYRGKIGNLIVCHRCDNTSCVNPDHLFLGTQKENMQDCLRKGRLRLPPPAKGEQHVNALLTDAQAKEICELLNQGIIHDKIGKKFNISGKVVSAISARKRWQHVSDIYLRAPKKYGSAVLNPEKAKEIRALYQQGRTTKQLALQFGVLPEQIRRIVTFKRWKDA